jgi:hypothetical protein
VAATIKKNKKSTATTIPQVPLDAITQENTLGITPNLTMMMNQ